MHTDENPRRRSFLKGIPAVAGLAGGAPLAAQSSPATGDFRILPRYARAMGHRSLKQSSHDRTGGNRDYFTIEPGATQELLNSPGPGVITHIWFTISAPSPNHLKELVLRAY